MNHFLKAFLFTLVLMSRVIFAENSQIIRANPPLTLVNGLMSCPTASGSQAGCLSAANWTTFNSKQNALTFGNLTSGTTGVTVTGGTGAVIGSGTSFTIQTASGSQPGLLSAADWTTFNSKQAAGNYITALTGDVTASGPGSVAATVAKIQGTTVSGTTGTTNVVFSDSPSISGSWQLTSSTGFGINATPSSNNIFLARRDQNGLTRGILTNGDVGSAAQVEFSLASGAGDFNFVATSIAGGALGYIATDSSFTGGLRIATNGANPLELRTNNSSALIINGSTQLVSIPTLTASQAVFTDGSKNLVSNAITGTGNVVMSASPTLTGTITAAAANFSGAITASNLSGTNTGDVTLTAFGSSANANGASLSGQVLTLQPADATNPGGVSTTAQSFGGVKTFVQNVNISKTSADPMLSINATTSGNPQIYWNGNARDWTMAVNGSTGLFSIARGTSVATGDFNITSGGNTSVTNTLSVGGVILNSSGDATAPSYSFTGDSDTGIYRRAANQIGFGVNGTEVGFTNGDWSLGLNNSSVVTLIGRTLVGNGSPVSAGAFNITNSIANGQVYISGGSSNVNGGAIRLDGGSSGGSNAVSFQYNGTDMGYFGGAGLDFTVVNHIRASNGTVGFPSISFTNGSTNGFFLTGGGSFGIVAGGIQMGSIGGAVQLVGSQANPLLIKGDLTNSTGVAIYHDNSGDANILNQFNGNIILGTNGSNFFTGTSAGNTLGIFRKDQNALSAIALINANAGSSAAAEYRLTNDADDSRLHLDSIAGGNALQLISNSGITGGIIINALGARSITLKTNGSNALVADSSQNVTVSAALKKGNYHIEPAEYNAGNSSTAQTIDWSNGSAQLSTLTGNVTYTFSNGVTGGAYVLKINTGAGSFSATWPAAVHWSGGTAPVITATASKVDLVNFYYDGTTWFGTFSQNYSP